MSDPSKRPANDLPVPESSARFWIVFGLFWIVMIFVGFGGWAATAPISSAVIAQGTFTVDSKRKSIQHLEGGIVETLLVRDGDEVEAGDGLIKLDPTRPRAMLAILSSSLRKELAAEARLIAERDGSATINYPQALMDHAHLPEVRAQIESQNAIFKARRGSVRGEVEILEQRIAQLGDEAKGLNAQLEAKRQQTGFITEELKGLKKLMAQGQTTKPRILALERSAAALTGEEGELLSSIARAKKTVGETRLEIIQRENDFQKAVTEELEAVQSRLRDLMEREVAARDVLTRILITAPVSGTIVNMAFHTVGAVIQGGEVIMEIVPGNDTLIAEVAIRPQDIDNVTFNQPASIRLLAFKQRTTPLLEGNVIYVSADSLENQTTRQQFYIAKIEVPKEELKKLGNMKLQPGMQVEVLIRTGDRTAFEYMVQPIVDSVNRAWREE
jgi:HlyD family type I secretion membrane fusion protein